MAADRKPRTRHGYSREETERIVSACLSVAVTLGAYADDVCLVGGLVPTLLIDAQREPGAVADEPHPGTLDLDLGLSRGLLDRRQYVAVSERLRQEGFGPACNQSGNTTLQTWRHGPTGVTVDFLMAPLQDADPGTIHKLEADFGALLARGAELAFADRERVPLRGRTLDGESASRIVPVCGPAAFVVLKALALADRAEPKDAFDLVYTLRRWPGGAASIAQRLARLESPVVSDALALLARDFDTLDAIGPSRVAAFEAADRELADEIAADAHGAVDDLLRACVACGLPVGTAA